MQDETARIAKCGSKLFIAGEYGVLVGLPGWVLSIHPCFQLELGTTANCPFPFHPESPAGKWKKMSQGKRMDQNDSWDWKDPHHGQGGWGGSTAEYLLTRALLGDLKESSEAWPRAWPKVWSMIWQDYQNLFREAKVRPSGADLVAQILGGCVEFQLDWTKVTASGQVPKAVRIDGEGFQEILQNFLVFRAAGKIEGRKIQTHAHLGELNTQGGILEVLNPVLGEYTNQLQRVGKSLASRNVEMLGDALKNCAALLGQVGLEHPGAREERLILSELPGVLGVKGLGAMLSDGILVVIKDGLKTNEPWDYERILATSKMMGLELVHSDPLELADGVSCL